MHHSKWTGSIEFSCACRQLHGTSLSRSGGSSCPTQTTSSSTASAPARAPYRPTGSPLAGEVGTSDQHLFAKTPLRIRGLLVWLVGASPGRVRAPPVVRAADAVGLDDAERHVSTSLRALPFDRARNRPTGRGRRPGPSQDANRLGWPLVELVGGEYGHQYRRSSSPIGVFGPTWVSISFSPAVNICSPFVYRSVSRDLGQLGEELRWVVVEDRDLVGVGQELNGRSQAQGRRRSGLCRVAPLARNRVPRCRTHPVDATLLDRRLEVVHVVCARVVHDVFSEVLLSEVRIGGDPTIERAATVADHEPSSGKCSNTSLCDRHLPGPVLLLRRSRVGSCGVRGCSGGRGCCCRG